MSLKTKGFSRKTEALIWIGGGEDPWRAEARIPAGATSVLHFRTCGWEQSDKSYSKKNCINSVNCARKYYDFVGVLTLFIRRKQEVYYNVYCEINTTKNQNKRWR